MLRALQTVGWSLLAPQPIQLESGNVAVFLGPNGSGKSSALDALKAVLGCRRFGQSRTAASYRFAGRAGAPAAKTAYVLALVDNVRGDGTRRLDGYGDELTLVLEVGPDKRWFLVLDGDQLLDCDRLDDEVAALRSDYPRSKWMRPAEYETRVLDALGIGPAVRRLLELPQGEVQRALDRDPRSLVGLLVELAGGRDAADAFERAKAALVDARNAHAEARRRHDRRRADLAEQRLAFEAQRHAGDLRARLAELGGAMRAVLDTNPPPQPRARPAPKPKRPEPRPVLGIAALRRQGVRLILRDGVWAVEPEHVPRAQELLGPGETLPVAADGLSELLKAGLLVCGPRVEGELAADPDPEPEPEPEPSLAPRLRAGLEGALARLQSADVEVRDFAGDELPDPGELLGAFRALAADGVPAPPDPGAEERLAALAVKLRADAEELEGRGKVLTEASEHLQHARERYDHAVVAALQNTAERFERLCADAGLAGRIEVAPGPDGATVRIFAAESAGEELRALHGAQASLSGGWRATVVVLCLLACLEGANGGLEVLPLDEVGSSLDEPRLVALGHAFRRLGEQRGLMTVMTLPSKEMSEAVAAFASQQVGFVRPLADEPLAPPPHIVTAPARA